MTARLDPLIERFRFAHHNVAMMFAMGMTAQEISRKIGYTQRRLTILLKDPTFRELIEHYQSQHTRRMLAELPTAIENMEFVRVGTIRQMMEHLEESEESGELISIPNLIRMHGEMADRTGYSKHTLKTVLNVSFAAELDRAIERSGKGAELRLIEGGLVPLSEERPQVVDRPKVFRRA